MVLNPGCTLGSSEQLLKRTDARALPKEVDGIDLERAQPVILSILQLFQCSIRVEKLLQESVIPVKALDLYTCHLPHLSG